MTSRLSKHIEQLLERHTSVTVPGLGSFLVEMQPAHLDAEACLIYPTASELCFSELLQHQDGLLAQSYAEAFAVSHRRARLMLDEDVRSLRNSLIRRRRITLGTLGTLSLGESGGIVFEPQQTQSFHGTAYGLSPIALPQVFGSTESHSGQSGSSDYLNLRISKRSLSWASAVAVFILALLPWGKSVEREPVYRASIAPAPMLEQQHPEPSTEEATADAEASPKAGWLTPSSGTYYIIIATEKTPERAEAHYANALGWLPEAQHTELGILQDKKLYRVSAAHFTEASDAYAYIGELSRLGKEAWVYRAK